MINNYKNTIKKYGSDYRIKQAVENGELFKLDSGLYSDKERISDLEFLSFSRPDGVFTMKTAFFIYGLTDEIPDIYDMAIDRLSSKTKYKRCKVKYYYQPKEILNIGKINYKYNGNQINIYDKERLLIELFRYYTKLPFDFYKEIINSYRKIDIDFEKLQKYISKITKSNRIYDKVILEIL